MQNADNFLLRTKIRPSSSSPGSSPSVSPSDLRFLYYSSDRVVLTNGDGRRTERAAFMQRRRNSEAVNLVTAPWKRKTAPWEKDTEPWKGETAFWERGRAPRKPQIAPRLDSWTSEWGEEDQLLEATKPSNIGVVGMKQVFSSETRRSARVFWSTVLLFFLALFITQFADRLSHFLGNPVKVTMKIKRASEMAFPTITICNKQFYSPTRAKPYQIQAAKTLGLDEEEITLSHMMAVFDPKELWMKIGFQLEDVYSLCFFGRNQTCGSQGRFVPVLTIMGLCYKFVLNNKISNSGYFNNFHARLHNPKSHREERGWKVFLGGQRGDPVLRVTTNAMTIRPGWEPDIQVLVKEFKTLPTKADPCASHSEYSQLDCELESFQEVLEAKGGCWLPFMTEQSLQTMPKCPTAQAYNNSLRLADQLLFYGNWTNDGCSCMSACDDVTYEAFTDSRVDNTSTTTRVRIFYNDLTYEAVHEDWAYKIISFMCDVGGSLGLLLGASVLTFIEILECVIVYCSQSCCSKKTKVNIVS